VHGPEKSAQHHDLPPCVTAFLPQRLRNRHARGPWHQPVGMPHVQGQVLEARPEAQPPDDGRGGACAEDTQRRRWELGVLKSVSALLGRNSGIPRIPHPSPPSTLPSSAGPVFLPRDTNQVVYLLTYISLGLTAFLLFVSPNLFTVLPLNPPSEGEARQ
jgi:hypothetical protein